MELEVTIHFRYVYVWLRKCNSEEGNYPKEN